MWVMFRVPCPTPDGRTAQDLYHARVDGINEEMRASAHEHGCRFHRAWYASDGSAFYVIAHWETLEGGHAFYESWAIAEEPGEVTIRLEGDIGLVPLPELAPMEHPPMEPPQA